MNSCTCKPNTGGLLGGERHASSCGLNSSDVTSCSVAGQRCVSWPIPKHHLSLIILTAPWRVRLPHSKEVVSSTSVCVSLTTVLAHSDGFTAPSF